MPPELLKTTALFQKTDPELLLLIVEAPSIVRMEEPVITLELKFTVVPLFAV